MSLSLREFHRSLRALLPDEDIAAGDTIVSTALEGGSVTIRFEQREGTTLGGLLALPRASVTLEFSQVKDNHRRAFLARFDKAFQRGGG